MMPPRTAGVADPATRMPRVCIASAGFLLDVHLHRILKLSGHALRLALPRPGDLVAVWGARPNAARSAAFAARRGAGLLWVEDAFLRSVRPGRMAPASGRRRANRPLGLLIDDQGLHFDASRPNGLEALLARALLDDTSLLDRARDGIGRLRAMDLSKYNLHDPALAPPAPGYVLIIDQTRGDAAICGPGIGYATFREMLMAALDAYPLARILIRSHPETAAGLRPGHFVPEDAQGRVSFTDPAISPWQLLDGAIAVYAVSSQMGFEAILAGHRPQVYGTPFYAGWGLSEDQAAFPRRGRRLTRAQLFAAAMILYPVWYDACRDRLCSFEEALDQLEAEVRAYRQDRAGHVAFGMRLWKRGAVQRCFGREKPVMFENDAPTAIRKAFATSRSLLIWAGKMPSDLPEPSMAVLRVEDGFVRSRGLGAALVPPVSLVADDLGIYYDPGRESRLERLIAAGPPPGGEARARRLVAGLHRAGLTKYSTGRALPGFEGTLPPGPRILVPGQVEDDASLRFGAGPVRTNLDLLRHVRAAHPGAVILYKPHPDVAAGLRPGALPAAALEGLALAVPGDADPAVVLGMVQSVWTMTSTLGFEALLRGLPVTCLGAPFYAGWGLTRDLGPIPARRVARPTLDGLAHACLIAYPRYTDPVTGRPCPPEVAVSRLAAGRGAMAHGPGLRLLAKLQGLLAGQAHRWR